jgi:ABC-2 type transport system permease protein
MSPRVATATAARVLTQLRHDRRTLVLLLLVPAILLALLSWVFADQDRAFDRVAGPMLGLFPFITMFLVTSIAMLRERTTGTLERLMTMPLAKLDLLLGYGLAFAVVGILQASITAGVAFGALGLDVAGSEWLIVALAVGNALLGMAFGLFLSAFAANEFQAMQFLPAFVLPQLLLCGLFVPREQMSAALEVISQALPLTYAFDALAQVATDGAGLGDIVLDVVVIVGGTLLALALGAATLRRRTA